MANITPNITAIRESIFGKNVRENIASGIEAINAQADVVSKQFEDIVASAGNSNTEIVVARTNANGESFSILGDRLNNQDLQLSAKANVADVDTKISSVASGSPKGIFLTLALLQSDTNANTVDGKKNIYLVTADGKWYYWNGSAWTAGGTYQSTGIADKSIKPTYLDRIYADATVGNNKLDLSNFTSGVYAGGVTITVENGIVILNGTSTVLDNIILGTYASSGIYVLYAFNPIIAPTDTAYLNVVDETATTQLGTAIMTSINRTGTLANYAGTAKVRMRIPSGVTFDNFVMKPMIVENGITITEFEKYTFEAISCNAKSIKKKHLSDEVLSMITKSRNGVVTVDANGNGDYETINEALSGISDSSSNIVTILIMPGAYKETIDITNRYVSIVGLDKNNTIIYTDTGDYDYPPVKSGGGNTYIKSLTLLSTHDNPLESYSTTNRAYALHADYTGSGLAMVEDCNIVSHQCAALGTGTRPNRKHIFKNCNFELIDDGDNFNPLDTKYGAVFAHSHQAVAEGYQNYEFHNCIFKSDYANAIRLLQSYSIFRCLFVNCFVQGTNKTISMTNSVDAVSFIDSDSFGNNATTLNA